MLLQGLAAQALWPAIVVNGQWQPGIGDPTPIGWITVIAYFLAAILCGVRWGLPRFRPAQSWRYRPNGTLWLWLAVLLLLLGINKQLDLQSWFTVVGRQMALDNGWYRQRREVQVQFIIVLGLSAIAVLFGLGRLWVLESHRAISSRWGSGLALLGFVFLCGFVMLRAASFHHVDQLLRGQWLGLTVNGFLELLGIGLVAAGAWLSIVTLTPDYPQRPR